MHLKLLTAGLLLLALLLSFPAHAQDGVSLHRDRGRTLILITGPISSSTRQAALPLIEANPGGFLLLMSPGGNLAQGLAIGAAAREARMITIVPPDASCFSTCAYIWIAGVDRMLGPGARLGFHAAFREQRGGNAVVSGPGNAWIGAYLSQLGIGLEAITLFTSAGPRETGEVTLQDLARLGIAARALGGPVLPRVVAPLAAPRAAPAQPLTLHGQWEGHYRCGRDVIAANLLIWADGPLLGATFEFGPSFESPDQPFGAVGMIGHRRGENLVHFSPEQIFMMPPGHAPSGFLARLDQGRLTAEFDLRGPCGALALAPRRP